MEYYPFLLSLHHNLAKKFNFRSPLFIMKQHPLKASQYLYICIVCAIYTIGLFLLSSNLTNECLSYDEAGQFFLSQGLNHYSEPYSNPTSLTDVIKQNQDYNQDPGGFSIVLHFWSILSCNIIWLRTLPFLFYIGAILFTCLTTFEITRNKLLSLTSGLLLLALWGGDLPYCLRAYSMELCGMAYGLWMTFRLLKPKSGLHIVLYSTVLASFLTARYTIIIFGAIYGLICIYNICHWQDKATLSKRLSQIILFGIPLLLSVGYSYFFAMRIQNPNIAPMNYAIYLWLYNWPFKLVIIGLILATITLKWQLYKTRLLTIICITINVTFIFLGYFKLLPWTLMGIKGNCFVWLWYITMFCCAISLTQKLLNRYFICNYVFLASTIFFIVWSQASTNILTPKSTREENISNAFNNLQFPLTDKIVVLAGMSPSVRYIFEHGSLKSDKRFSYPTDFIFLFRGKHHNGSHDDEYLKNNYNFLDTLSGKPYLIGYTIDKKIFPDSYVPFGPYEIAPVLYRKF